MENQKLIEDLMDLSIKLGIFVMGMKDDDPAREAFFGYWKLTLTAKEALQSYEVGSDHGE